MGEKGRSTLATTLFQHRLAEGAKPGSCQNSKQVKAVVTRYGFQKGTFFEGYDLHRGKNPVLPRKMFAFFVPLRAGFGKRRLETR